MVGVLICFCLFGFVILLVQLFTIQIIHGEMYQSRAAQQQTRSTNLEAKRGSIYDRNGTVLAQSATVWNVCLSPADIKGENFDIHAQKLAEILNVDKAFILEQAADTRSYYKRIARRVNVDLRDTVLKYVDENNVAGVFFEIDTKRYYTYGNLASTVIGFTNYDNHGAYGLEAYYDKTLSGTPGVVVSTKNAKGSDMHLKYQQMNAAKDGNSIVLTIDEGIQHFLEKNLETAIVEHSIGNRAAGIVMNVNTGEILAMATKGDFNPNSPNELQDAKAIAELEEYEKQFPKGSEEYEKFLQQLRYDQWRNKAISDTYEPGSVFKIVTAATGIDNKIVSLNDQFFCTGSIKVSDRIIHCHDRGGHGAQNFTEGMQHSCNPVFITIGQRIGARLLHDYISNFGLGERTGIDLPGEAEGILHSYETLNKEGMVELASTSFGQTFKVTPIQLITAVSSAVNGGNLMKPYIVKQILDHEGNVIQTNQPTIRRQTISAESSQIMRGLVEAVVDGGSGRNAAIPGYRIGGKTGTSQKLDEAGNALNILSFVGFAPMENPQYAVLVMLDEPIVANAYGSVIAAPVVGAILQEMLPYVGIDPVISEEDRAEKEVKVPYLIGYKPHDAQSELTIRGLQTRLVGSGAEVIRQIPQSGQVIPKGMTVTLYTDEESLNNEITVPSVVGMTAQEANKVIVTNSKLNIILQGVLDDGVETVVIEQWPLAGTTAQTGEVVTVTLGVRKAEPVSEPITEAATLMGPEQPNISQ